MRNIIEAFSAFFIILFFVFFVSLVYSSLILPILWAVSGFNRRYFHKIYFLSIGLGFLATVALVIEWFYLPEGATLDDSAVFGVLPWLHEIGLMVPLLVVGMLMNFYNTVIQKDYVEVK